ITSLIILSYYQSQMTYLGNSINIAGKNRFLTSNLMFSTAEYFMDNKNDISKIKTAIDQLESNLLTLKNGGRISGIDLKPLPSEFSGDWDNVNQEWIELKSTLLNNILKQNPTISSLQEGTLFFILLPSLSSSTTIHTAATVDNNIKISLEAKALSLVNSSNALVTKLGEYAKQSSQYSVFLQGVFAVLNIGVTTAFIFYIIRKLLKPILALTTATYEVKNGNLNVVIKSKVNGNGDELSFLSDSFNSMVNSIKNYIKKQNQLTKELEKANEELKYRDQLKDEFINVAAHELKTPIQPIIGLCELLRERDSDIERDEEILDVIIRNSKRLMKLAENILNVAKIEGGSFFLRKEKFDINELIVEVMKDIQHKIVENKKNIKLLYKSYNDYNINNKIIVDADRNRISQVISNLLNNALNFTNEGSISVIIEERKKVNDNGNEIIVSIKDTGVGIDPEILPKLFTKFASKSLIPGGTGLGLFISKSIIEMHGGKIWANNNVDNDGRETKGSSFTFSLPLM
ncbi:MAG TPA: HAMP domain-containing sensor histidine kinase, partial [Nitrososphaeraceae archaeon]|nr:HAMP domain-containing sensor histidine kinase [Nitrososphaeraceae archaeon]